MRKQFTRLFCALALIFHFSATAFAVDMSIGQSADLIQQSSGTSNETSVRAHSSSLPAAISTIGDAATTLLIDTGVNVAASITIPANVVLRFTGSGYFNISSGGVVTILGNVDAPRARIFRGAGAVRFTGQYPEAFYPEWWGAMGDSRTDDLAAFDAMLASMLRPDSGGLPLGGRVELQGGKYYKLSDTLHLRRNIHLTGRGGRDTAGLTFAENKVGVVAHSLSTVDGKYTVANGRALNAMIENLSITATPGTTTNSTVSVSGLTVTRTAGTAFDQTASVQDGNTILINGHDYLIGSINSASKITLLDNWPIRIHTAGGTNVVTNIGFQYVPADWVGATISINSVNYKITAVTPGHYGATLKLSGTPPAFSGTTKIVGGFSAPKSDLPARMNIYHGLDLRAGVTVRNVQISGFHGNGVNANSTQTPSFNLSVEPNANHMLLERIWSDFNSGSGFYFKGVNSNASTMIAFSAQANHGYGVYENSFLGNTHISHHLLSNWLGGYRSSESGTNISSFVNCYAEGDEPANTFGPGTLLVGGNYGNGFDEATTSAKKIGLSASSDSWLQHGEISRGNLGQPVKLLTSADTGGTANISFTYYFADTSGGTLNYNLPTPQDTNIGRAFTFRRATGTNAFTLFATGGANIDGAGSLAVSDNAVTLVYAGGSIYRRIDFTGGKVASHDIGSGASLTKVLSATGSLNFTALAANSCEVLTINVTGAAEGDVVSLAVPNALADVDGASERTTFFGWVSAANTISVRRCNPTGSLTNDPPAASVRAMVTRF